MISFEHILPPKKILVSILQSWIQEDIPSFDFGTAILNDEETKGFLYCKQQCVLRAQDELLELLKLNQLNQLNKINQFNKFNKINQDESQNVNLNHKLEKTVLSLLNRQNVEIVLAGKPFIDVLFKDIFDCKIEWLMNEGETIQMGEEESLFEQSNAPNNIKSQNNLKSKVLVATITGKKNNILQGERIALNILSRCSGISTLCKRVRNLANACNFNGELAITRKTTPGFRLLEKYSAIVGGFSPHRYDVSQMIMLKDNHITANNGEISEAVKKVKKLAGFSTMIEVESSTLEEALDAAKSGANIVMLDNFSPEDFHKASKILKSQYPHVIIEGSGGISITSIYKYFTNDCDVLSMSFTIQGHPCSDFSLKLNHS